MISNDEVKKNEYTNALRECLECMNSDDNIQVNPKKLLTILKNFYHATMVSLMETNKEGDIISFHDIEFESSMMEDLISIKVRDLNDVFDIKDENNEHRIVYVKDIASIKDSVEACEIKKVFDKFNADSLMCIQLIKNKGIRGYILLINPSCNTDELTILKLVGSYVSNELARLELWNQRTYELTHDKLTGCYNRTSYVEFVNEIREAQSLGFILADVNRISSVNEILGYEMGDKIISEIASIIKENCVGYPVFRFDSDEFMICCVDIENNEFEMLFSNLKNSLSKHEYGAALGHVWDDFDIDAKRLYDHAKELMLYEKQKLHEQAGNEYENTHKKTLMSIMNHFSNNDFVVYLQPKVNMKSGEYIGAEALIRLNHPEQGLMTPGNFIPMFEKTGTIHLIDLFVFESVCQILEGIKKQGYPLFPISFNFSRKTLVNADLLEKVEEIVSKYDVDRKYLEVEITESIGELENSTIRNMAQSLHNSGFKISMDDFGTKYSSISVLSLMKCDILKIDRSMVNEITYDEVSKKVVSYVVAMCHDLGIECIAEGIENISQAECLMDMGCDLAQGYFYGKPMPEEDFINIIKIS